MTAISLETLQIEEGSTATPYEPPAPSPDYPIEIHSLNDFDVVSSVEKLTKGQLEEYDYDSEYENIDKINLSLSEPLRSVGDVKDRLFRDSDGLWKVERNVGEYKVDSSTRFSPDGEHYYISDIGSGVKGNTITSTHFPYLRKEVGSTIPYITFSGSRYIEIHGQGKTITEFRSWVATLGVGLIYGLATPTIEPLDQELQDKLNTLKSFKGSNYVYTVQNTDSPHKEQLKPTLHATFNSKDYLKEARTLTNLLIWARELTDEELIHHNQLFLNRFNLKSDTVSGEPIEQTLNLLHGGVVGHSLEQNYTINI